MDVYFVFDDLVVEAPLIHDSLDGLRRHVRLKGTLVQQIIQW